jgi:hypothetical protein
VLRAIVAENLSSLRHKKMGSDDNLQLIWKAAPADHQARGEISALHAEMLERILLRGPACRGRR